MRGNECKKVLDGMSKSLVKVDLGNREWLPDEIRERSFRFSDHPKIRRAIIAMKGKLNMGNKEIIAAVYDKWGIDIRPSTLAAFLNSPRGEKELRDLRGDMKYLIKAIPITDPMYILSAIDKRIGDLEEDIENAESQDEKMKATLVFKEIMKEYRAWLDKDSVQAFLADVNKPKLTDQDKMQKILRAAIRILKAGLMKTSEDPDLKKYILQYADYIRITEHKNLKPNSKEGKFEPIQDNSVSGDIDPNSTERKDNPIDNG